MNPSPPPSRWLLVRIGDRRFAMPAARVKAVLPARAASPLPLSCESLAGITLFRGHVLPLVDPRAALGMPPVEAGAPGPIVVVGLAGGFGLLVSEVLGMTLAGAVGEIRSGRKAVEYLDPDLVLRLELLRQPGDDELKAAMLAAEEEAEGDVSFVTPAVHAAREE